MSSPPSQPPRSGVPDAGSAAAESSDGTDARLARVDEIVTRALAEVGPDGALDVDALVRAHPDLERELRAAALGLSSLVRSSERLGMDGPPGSIGPYRVLREVGRGGMGVVYEAEDPSLGRRVALKVLPLAVSAKPGYVERFRREALAAARLEHPNVVPVYGVDEADGQQFIVMKFVDGYALDELCAELGSSSSRSSSSARPVPVEGKRDALKLFRSGRLGSRGGDASSDASGSGRESSGETQAGGPLRLDRRYYDNVARVGLAAANALSYAHERGVLHRDVKPGNILVERHGHVWVADFGLAKIDESDDLTHEGGFVGTLRYTAPEQFQGHAEPRSDVYGLGLVLYELLALRPAIEKEERAEVVHEVLYSVPPSPDRVRPTVPPDLARIVMKAIAKLPEQRYRDARAMAADLGAFLDGRPIRARMPSALYITRLAYHRNRLLFATIGLLLAVVAAGALAYTLQLRRSADAESRLAYRGQLAAAAAALRGGDAATASVHLEACPPDQRGWEWAHLFAASDQSLRTVSLVGHDIGSVAVRDGEILVAHRNGVRVVTEEGERTVTLPGSTTKVKPQIVRAWNLGDGWLVHHFQSGLWRCSIEGIPIDTDARDVEGVLNTRIGRGAMASDYDPVSGRFVLGERQGQIFVVDSTTFEVLGSRESGVRGLQRIVVAPGGGHAWSISSEGKIHGWNLDTLERVEIGGEGGPSHAIPPCPATSIAYHAPTHRLAVGRDDHSIVLIDLADGTTQWLTGCERKVTAVAFSPDGARLASASNDRVLRLWDAFDGVLEQTLYGLARSTTEICFLPSGETLLTGGNAGVVQEWSVHVPGGRAMVRGHYGDVVGLAFATDGRRFATGGREATIRIHDAASLRLDRVLLGHRAELNGVVWCLDDRYVVGVDRSGEVIGFDVATGDVQWRAELEGVAAEPLVLGERGELLVVAASGGRVEVRRAEDGAVVATRLLEDAEPSAVFARGDRLWVGLRDGRVLVLDRTTLETVRSGRPHADDVSAFAWLELTGQLVSASWDGTLAFLDPKTLAVARRTRLGGEGHSATADGIDDLAVSPDGERVAAACHSWLVRLVDARTGENVLDLSGHNDWVRRVAFSPDGQTLISTGSYSSVRVWDVVDSVARAEAVAARLEFEEAARAQWAAWLGAPLSDPEDVDAALAVLAAKEIRHAEFEEALRAVLFQERGARITSALERYVLAGEGRARSGLQFVGAYFQRRALTYPLFRLDAVSSLVSGNVGFALAQVERLRSVDPARASEDPVVAALEARLTGSVPKRLLLAAQLAAREDVDAVDHETARRILAWRPSGD